MNTKEEFIEHIAEKEVTCSVILYSSSIFSPEKRMVLYLRTNHTKEEYDLFIASLDFTYYSGYGAQELFGTIWYTDGSYSERDECDGLEWWEHRTAPVIPKECL